MAKNIEVVPNKKSIKFLVKMVKKKKVKTLFFYQTFKVEESKMPSLFSIFDILTLFFGFVADIFILLIFEIETCPSFYRLPYLGQSGKFRKFSDL